MQNLFCHPSFITKVELEWVDDIKYYNAIVNGANEAATPELEKFTEQNLPELDKADLMVYMTKDNTENANGKGDTIGRAHYRAACDPSVRKKAHSINEWNIHTHYFGGVSFLFSVNMVSIYILQLTTYLICIK